MEPDPSACGSTYKRQTKRLISCIGVLAAIIAVSRDRPLQGAEPAPPDVVITPHGHDAHEAFDWLEGLGGPRVAAYGCTEHLLVPPELRFRPVAARELVPAVAASLDLQVFWLQDGKFAVLYATAPDAEIERVRTDLQSADPRVRCDAAWRASWLCDPRLLPLLVKAAKDPDRPTSWHARHGLYLAGWKAVLALVPAAGDLLPAELEDEEAGPTAAACLGLLPEDKALPLIEKVLNGKDNRLRQFAAGGLSYVRGEKARALFEKLLLSGDMDMSYSAAQGFSDRTGDESTLSLMEKVLAAKNPATEGLVKGLHGSLRAVQSFAAEVEKSGKEKVVAALEKDLAAKGDHNRPFEALRKLGTLGTASAVAVLERALGDPDERIRYWSLEALEHVGAEQALSVLEKALTDPRDDVRHKAASVLSHLAGPNAMALREKAFASKDAFVRAEVLGLSSARRTDAEFAFLVRGLSDEAECVQERAASGIAAQHGEKALACFEKEMALPDPARRLRAVRYLRETGGEGAFALAERAMDDKDEKVRRAAVRSALKLAQGERAWEWACKTIVDPRPEICIATIENLPKVDAKRARNLLLERFLIEKNTDVLWRLRGALKERFPDDLMVQQALRESPLHEVIRADRTPDR